jgi:hypothetical protein
MLSSNMLLLNLILLIDVTFSTPTPDYASYARALPTALNASSMSTREPVAALPHKGRELRNGLRTAPAGTVKMEAEEL